MYAVILSGGKQYRVSEGDTLKLESLSAEVGQPIDFDQTYNQLVDEIRAHAASQYEPFKPAAAPATTIPASSGAVIPAEFTCAGKTYCREMASCDEARFYFTSCGLSRLDGDSDGLPCESICNQ